MENFWRNIIIGGVVAYFLFRKKKHVSELTFEEKVERQAIADEYVDGELCRVLLTSGILDKGIYKPGILPDDFCIQGIAHLTGESFSFGDPFAEEQAEKFKKESNASSILDDMDSIIIELQNDTATDADFDVGDATEDEKVWNPIPVAPAVGDATGVGATGFTARWSASTGATGYYLDVATDSGFTSLVAGYENKDVGNVTSSSVTGLTGGTTYYYRLRAYNTTGTSSDSDTTTVLLIPAAPSVSAATSVLQTSFTANWSASTGATGYYLDVATDNTFTAFVTGFENKDVGNVTNANVTGLNSNVTYYYRLRAYNASGTSSSSSTITTTTEKYKDYFLPSRDELDAMRINLYNEGVGGFDGGIYWCSTEGAAASAFNITFVTGNLVASTKDVLRRVRACRSFTAAVGAYSLRDVGQAGGLICYIDGTTYYEAAPSDQSTSQAWSNIDDTEIGASAQGTTVGTGQGNTTAIIGQAGHISSAAKLCDDLEV